jgi:hypothetical protein
VRLGSNRETFFFDPVFSCGERGSNRVKINLKLARKAVLTLVVVGRVRPAPSRAVRGLKNIWVARKVQNSV